jgi:N-acetylglutamate synthase-like GNAT family acetyltransferase
MIKKVESNQSQQLYETINDGAQVYQGVIPADCWQEPYMPQAELQRELAGGVVFWGLERNGRLLGAMGRQDRGEVFLIRHAHVLRVCQQQGIGSQLLAFLLSGLDKPTLVGTWAAAWWAVQFYQKHGFQMVTSAEKDRLLRTYWNISERQVETSVVLADERWSSAKVRTREAVNSIFFLGVEENKQ